MASEIIVNTIKAPTTGANANKIIVPTGVKLEIADSGALVAPESVIQRVRIANSAPNSNSSPGTWANTNYTISITPQYANSLIKLSFAIPFRLNGNTPMRGGFRCNRTINGANSNTIINTNSNVEQHQVRNASNEYDDVYSAFHVDTPNTTGTVNYMFQTYIHTDSGANYFSTFDANIGGYLMLEEIAQ